MPRVISCDDDQSAGLSEVLAQLDSRPFCCTDEDSLTNAALALRRLYNDRDFLGDMLVAQLADADRNETQGDNGYGPQSIMLSGVRNGYFLRANIWPSERDEIYASSGARTFVYGVPHDHNFSFLTIGYFGPGYRSAYYEYEYTDTVGFVGERPGLRFVEESALDEGKMQLYRAHLDIHDQIPPETMSVSLNVIQADEVSGWFDQYGFDLESEAITGLINPNAAETFLRIAVGLGGAEAQDLAERFGRSHPSDRIRLASYEARAALCTTSAGRDALWCEAERRSGSVRVQRVASLRRRALEAV